MKGYLFLIIAILSMTFFSCEKETETETEKTAKKRYEFKGRI